LKKTLVLFVLFSCCLLISCNSQPGHGTVHASEIKFTNGKESTTIPFERYKDWIILKVKVNDAKVLSFLFDSGAPIAILREGVSTGGLNLNITGKVAVRGASGSPVDVPFATGVKFTLGDAEISNASMAAGMPTDVLTGLDGIIGKCIFENAVVSINWKASTLTITQKDKYQYKGNGSILPLYALSSGHIATDVLLENGGKKFSTKAVVDLGNRSGSHVDNIKASMLVEGNTALKNIIIGWGATGPSTGDISRISISLEKDITLNKVPFAFKKVGEAFAQQDAYSNIGLDILSRFNLVFDYPGKRLILEKNDTYNAEFLYNQSGILQHPKREGDYISVAGIIPSSPAEEAGIKIGDKIISANGITAEIKNLHLLNEILTGKKTPDIELSLERNGTVFKKKIKPRKLI